MINYYLRADGAYVRLNTETKEIINLVNFSTQKTIPKLNNESYYNTILEQIPNWSVSDESTFNSNLIEVTDSLNIL